MPLGCVDNSCSSPRSNAKGLPDTGSWCARLGICLARQACCSLVGSLLHFPLVLGWEESTALSGPGGVFFCSVRWGDTGSDPDSQSLWSPRRDTFQQQRVQGSFVGRWRNSWSVGCCVHAWLCAHLCRLLSKCQQASQAALRPAPSLRPGTFPTTATSTCIPEGVVGALHAASIPARCIKERLMLRGLAESFWAPEGVFPVSPRQAPATQSCAESWGLELGRVVADRLLSESWDVICAVQAFPGECF